MNDEVRWLIRLGLEQSLFSQEQSDHVEAALGRGASLMDFAQRLIDDGHVEDIEALENLAGVAVAKAREDDTLICAQLTDTPVERPRLTAAPFPTEEAAATDFDHLLTASDDELRGALGVFLDALTAAGASDLHLSAGTAAFYRKHGRIHPLSSAVLSAEDALRLNSVFLSEEQRTQFYSHLDLDLALTTDSGSRYRVNLLVQKNGVSGSYRMVAHAIPVLDQIGIKSCDVVRKLLSYHNGLILVTGPVGSGKTTTLAALVAELNRERDDHIITIEDPIEFVQPADRCNITQRQIGDHTRSFATALKAALREDPDIIIIGELRDLETIEMAITAAETGHLVIATMHTSDAATTLNRLLDVFPSAQQSQIRASVAESLRGIICQRLLPRIDGGLVMASELLIANIAVGSLIREGKTQGLRNTMETGLRDGMHLLEADVFDLWQKEVISASTAREHITNRILKSKIID